MSHTYEEIRSQPAVWQATIRSVHEQWSSIAPRIRLTPETQFLLVGSGSSLHVARTAAHSLQETTRHVARAVASSEVFLSSDSTVPRDVPVLAFVISRSGETSEAVLAAGHLVEHFDNVTVVGLTCTADTGLERRTHHSIKLADAAERSVVMTRSFTSLILALQMIGGSIARDRHLVSELGRLPDLLVDHMERSEHFAQGLGPDLNQDQFIFLGLGPNEGIAQDAMLKLKEMTQANTEAYNPLEFRHGPISIVREGTTVVILEGLRERAFMADLENDLAERGAYVATIAPYPVTRAAARLDLHGEISDIARCILYMPVLQLIAYHRAIAAGLDPDQPRNLTKVVVLSDVDRGSPSA